MKTSMIKALAASAVLAAGLASTGAQAATATADAKATILTQVVVTKTSDLDFGVIAVGTSGGNVLVDSASARTCTGGLVCSGTTTAAGFSVTGVTGQTVGISVPANVTLNSGTNSMSASLDASASSLVISATATANTFKVGGDLTVSATQAAGAYVGTFTATVNYQ